MKPLIFMTPGGVGASSSVRLVLNWKFCASTCSIRSEAVIALSMLFTDTFTSPCEASGSAIRFVNWACSFPGESRVTRPMIWMTSVSDARYPTVSACSANGQSKPSFAMPSATITSTASRSLDATEER